MAAPKLVLLTDFSPLSRVAMRFALRMASPLGAEFTIMNVVRIEGVPKANLRLRQIERTLTQIAEEEGALLIQELKNEVKGHYKLNFVAVRSHTVAESVQRFTEKNPVSMIVMGSRGASALKKARLGGTTVSVIDRCSVPVLAIPDFAQYKNLQHIVYATDFKNTQKELATIVEFAQIYGSFVHMIHVVPAVDKKVEANAIAIEEIVKKASYSKIDFKLIIDDDIPSAIDKYIKETKADLLTTFEGSLSLIDKLFAKSVTRTLAYLGTIPLLVIKRK